MLVIVKCYRRHMHTAEGSNLQHLQIITRGLTFSLPHPPFIFLQTPLLSSSSPPPSALSLHFPAPVCVVIAFHIVPVPTVKASTSELSPALTAGIETCSLSSAEAELCYLDGYY